MKQTSNLKAILDELKQGPRTAVDIINNLDIDKTVVYRTIKRLLSQNKLEEIHLTDGSIAYELADTGHHHHLICVNCNVLKCIDLPNKLQTDIHSFENKLKKDFDLVGHRVDFFINCGDCS